MAKCTRCGVETDGHICGRCEMEERNEWYRQYERRAIDSPNENILAAWYRKDKKGGI